MISKLNKAGKQFVSPNAKANGYELLKVVCYRDDRLKERALEIIDLLGSIKVLGPIRTEEEVLMDLPNRKQLREMIIERVKADWYVDES